MTNKRSINSRDYVHGTSPAERERLLAQSKVFAPEAGWFLDLLAAHHKRL